MTATNNGLIYVTARISFPNIVDPQVTTNEKGETRTSYNCDLIMAATDPGFQKFMQTYQQMAVEKWKENAGQAMQMIQADRKSRCYGAGEEKVSKKTFAIHQGYAGNVFITARSERQPKIVDDTGVEVPVANTMQVRNVASRIEGGMIVNAVIKPWLQQNVHGAGVRCDLVALQFAKDDGTRFAAAAVDTSGMFGAIAGAAPAAAAVPGFAPVAPMPTAPFPAAAAPAFGMPAFLGG